MMRTRRAIFWAAGVLTLAVTSLSATAMGETGRKRDVVRPPVVRVLTADLCGDRRGADVTVEVTNPDRRRAVAFYGYTPESFDGGLPKGTIMPLYRIETRGNGAWKPFVLGGCGVGKGWVEVAAGEKATFRASLPGGDWDAVRVGLTWRDPTPPDGSGVTTWSPAIDRKGVPKPTVRPPMPR
jgi:hypothetical protein